MFEWGGRLYARDATPVKGRASQVVGQLGEGTLACFEWKRRRRTRVTKAVRNKMPAPSTIQKVGIVHCALVMPGSQGLPVNCSQPVGCARPRNATTGKERNATTASHPRTLPTRSAYSGARSNRPATVSP